MSSGVFGSTTNGIGVEGLSTSAGTGTSYSAVYGAAAGPHNHAIVGQLTGSGDGVAIMGISNSTRTASPIVSPSLKNAAKCWFLFE